MNHESDPAADDPVAPASSHPPEYGSGFRIAPRYETSPALTALAKLSAAANSKLLAGIWPALDLFAERFPRTLAERFTTTLAPSLGRLVSPELQSWLKDSIARLREAVPPNWLDADDADWDVDWEAALTIMNEGIPLVWVPRFAIVSKLMKAPDAASRLAILEQGRLDIADDCSAALEEVTAASLMPLADLTREAARALGDRYCAASQALSANVFDTWLRDAARRGVVFTPPRGRFRYPHVVRQMKPVGGDARIRDLRPLGVRASILVALENFDSGDAVPERFGRHPTAHAAGPEQYTEVNAVIALMLATSVLRQAQAAGW